MKTMKAALASESPTAPAAEVKDSEARRDVHNTNMCEAAGHTRAHTHRRVKLAMQKRLGGV